MNGPLVLRFMIHVTHNFFEYQTKAIHDLNKAVNFLKGNFPYSRPITLSKLFRMVKRFHNLCHKPALFLLKMKLEQFLVAVLK